MTRYSLTVLTLILAIANGFSLSRYMRRPMVVYSPVEESLFRESQALINREFGQLDKQFGQFSPKYEITNTDDKFELAVDVPGVKSSDVNITLKGDGKVLAISGERQSKGENYSYSSKFYQSFSLDPTILADKFQANLQDGVLVISAPKDMEKIDASSQRIPITESQAEPKEETIEVEHKKEEVSA